MPKVKLNDTHILLETEHLIETLKSVVERSREKPDESAELIALNWIAGLGWGAEELKEVN